MQLHGPAPRLSNITSPEKEVRNYCGLQHCYATATPTTGERDYQPVRTSEMPVALLHDLPWDNEQAKARFMSEAGEQAKLVGREIFSSVEEFLTVLEDDMPSKVDRFKLLVSFSTDVYVGETNLYGERVPTGGRSSASRFVQSSDTRDPIPIQLFDYL